jgi:hypothetical protein
MFGILCTMRWDKPLLADSEAETRFDVNTAVPWWFLTSTLKFPGDFDVNLEVPGRF